MGRRKIELLAMAALWALCLSVVTVFGWGGRASASVVAYEPADLASEARIGALFERWRRRHGKVYGGEGERDRRFRAFRENLAYIDRRNREKRGHSQRVGLNRFADLTNEEFRAIYTRRIRRPAKRWGEESRRRELMASCVAPASLDWRKKGIVTPVKDQGQCGSCWAFSSTGAIEGINALVTGELVNLSEQELVDCDTTNYGCDGGYMDYAFEWVIQNGGIDTEADYSYTSVFGQGGSCNSTKEERKVVSIDGYEDVPEGENALLCAVVSQPVSVGIDGSAMDFQLYTGGIYDGDCSDNPDDIDHAVLIVGYGSQGGEDYWIVKNSWGTSWGDNGYIYMKRNTGLEYGLCAIDAMASYPTKEGSAAPSPYPSPAAPPPPSVPPPPPLPPPPPPPPPPPSPSPEQCGDGSYCNPGETCCCLFKFADICFIYGCCGYENAVCCEDSDFCCPHDYPICDILDGLCLQNAGDFLGVKMKKRKVAKRKLPWTKFEDRRKEADQPRELTWRGERVAAV